MLPNHFDDDFVLNKLTLQNEINQETNFNATLGLIVKLKKALKRLVKRQKLEEPLDGDYSVLLHQLSLKMTSDCPVLKCWSPIDLLQLAFLLEEKSTVLSGILFRCMDDEPLFPPMSSILEYSSKLKTEITFADGFIARDNLLFRKSFIDKVNTYHSSLKRPIDNIDASYSDELFPQIDHDKDEHDNSESSALREVLQEDNRISSLALIERDVCNQCKGRRQLYCGGCGGVRMENANSLLPTKLHLPFDVLLVLHW